MQAVVHIGDQVKRARVRQAIRQDELARQAGITPTTLSRIERNESEPHVSTIRKLAKALGTTPADLIPEED